MADCISSVILGELEHNVHDALIHLSIGSERRVKFFRKTRDHKSGDIIIPDGCMKIDEAKKTELLKYLERNCEGTYKNVFVKVCINRSALLSFYLNRPQFCKAVFKEIQDGGSRYGDAKVKQEGSVFIKCLTTRERCPSSLTDLRLGVISCHVERLIKASGYLVSSQAEHDDSFEQFVNTSRTENSTEHNYQQAARRHQSKLEKCFIEKARLLASSTSSSKQQQNKAGSTNDAVGLDDQSREDSSHSEDTTTETVVLDLKRIVQDRELFTGSDGIDKNLNTITVVETGKLTEVMEEAVRLAEHLQSKQCCRCLYVVPHQQVFRQQQVQLLLAVLSDEDIQQSFLVVGPVKTKQGEATGSGKSADTANAFYESRYQQMKEASEMRSGGTSGDQSSDRQIHLLTSASIKLDLLGNTSHNSLRVDASSLDCGAESRLGAFVLYNAARLANLMSHFAQCVQEALYPPLPPVEDIDCSLLREDEDWELVFQYLAAYPELVRQAVDVVFPRDGKNMARIHTHKVTNFIVAFTKCLSAHYSRYHVLTGGEPHLLPLMYARLYLLKCAHQVLINCLQLIDVEALPFL